MIATHSETNPVLGTGLTPPRHSTRDDHPNNISGHLGDNQRIQNPGLFPCDCIIFVLPNANVWQSRFAEVSGRIRICMRGSF